jgi:hypothetical protein
VEVREVHHGEPVERRVGVRRRQGKIDAAYPLRLVQEIDKAEGGGPGDRGRRPPRAASQPAQVASSGIVPAGPP